MAPANYLHRSDITEQERLHANQALIADATGGSIILSPLDLTQSNLRILDSCSSDGYWLHTLLPSLKDPAGATLVATDIAPVADSLRTFTPPANMQFQKQDINDPWPAEWEGSFDLVNQRLALVNAGSIENAVLAVRKLLKLVKPGGWIEMVEGEVSANQDVHESDLPSEKMQKLLATFLHNRDMFVGIISPRVREILVQAAKDEGIEIEEVVYQRFVVRHGKGAKESLWEYGYVQTKGMAQAMDFIKGHVGDSMPLMDMWNEDVKGAFMKEFEVKGWEMVYHAVRARRAT